jgi:polyether ionophore transport system permease protein
MAVDVGSRLAPSSRTVSPWSRVYGFGSVYAKTLRDSRVSFLIVAGLLGGIMFAAGAGVGSVYATQESRNDLARLAADLPPAFQGLTGGPPVNVGTIGGYMTWKYGPVFAWVASLWSILALSATLAAEAGRGSLDFVAATPLGRRRLAIEKVAAHLTAMAGAVAVLALAAWLAAAAFGKLPGDPVPPQAAIGFGLGVGLIGLASGSLAFALAPFLGRAGAAGIAGAVLFAGYVVNGYQAAVPAFAGIAHLTWFSWTANHLPLAGRYDWGSLLLVGGVIVALLGIGVEAFARRDLGASASLRAPALPGAVLGLRGPVGRAFGERLPTGLAWGLGLGIFAFALAAASRSLAIEFHKMSPATLRVFRSVLPGFDVTTAGGFLQLFAQLDFIVVGFAAVALVAGWASDEASGRLELLLSTPLDRMRWAVSGGLGVYMAIAVMTVVVALAIGFGALVAGSDAWTPMAGSVTFGLYAAAVASVGFAVGGLFRTSVAAEVVAVVVTLTYLVDLLAPALKLPDWVHRLALTGHLGQPMVGSWDVAGIVACVVLAAAGLALGGWGMSRRDVAR